MKIIVSICSLVLALLVGCATGNLPRGAKLVGGGLMIDYMAPVDGTVILVERTSGRIVATQSLMEGREFNFGPRWERCGEVLTSLFGTTNLVEPGAFPVVPTNTFFQLYFVPDPVRKD